MPVFSVSLRAALLAAVCALALTACQEEETGQSLLTKARAAHDKGDVRAALIHIQSSLKKNPANGEAELLHGRLLLETGNPAVAEEALGRAGRLGVGKGAVEPLRARAMLMTGRNQAVIDGITVPQGAEPAVAASLHAARGNAYAALKRPAEAERAFAAALAAQPGLTDALLGQAGLAEQQGDHAAALALTEQAIAGQPASVEAWVMKGTQLRELGRLPDSADAFARAVTLAPRAVEPLRGRGMAFMGMNQRDKARADLAAALKLAPDDAQTLLLLAWLDYQDGRYADAQTRARSAQKSGQAPLGAQLLDGAATLAMGAPQAAEASLIAVVNAAPDNRLAVRLLVRALLDMRQTPRATAILDQAMQRWPDEAPFLLLAAEARGQGGDHAGATALLEKAAASAPDDPSLRTRLGLAQFASGRTDQGLASLELASGLEKEGAQSQAMLVLTLLRTWDFDRALDIARGIADRQPKSPVGPYLIGLSRLGQGQRDRAREAFGQALTLDAKYLPAAGQLARIALDDGRPEDAARPFQAILAADPAHQGAMLALASLAERRRDATDRLQWLERARKADPKAMTPRAELVRAHLAAGADETALAVAREAVANDPASAQAVALLGQTELEIGGADRAVTVFRQMIKLSPYDPAGFVRLASVLMQGGQHRAAADAARDALRLSPGAVEAEATLVVALAQAGDAAEARKMLAGIAGRPGRAVLAATLEGDLLRAEKRLPEAVAAYERAFKAAPSERLAIRLHAVRVEAGVTTAADLLRQAMDAQAGWLMARNRLADVYLAAGNDRAAAEQYEILLRDSPWNGQAWNNLASAYARLNDPRALATAEKAYALRPTNPAVADTLGWLLVERGDVSRGLPLLASAVAGLPRESTVRYHYAVALAKAGRKEQAREEIKRLLDSGGTLPEGANIGSLFD